MARRKNIIIKPLKPGEVKLHADYMLRGFKPDLKPEWPKGILLRTNPLGTNSEFLIKVNGKNVRLGEEHRYLFREIAKSAIEYVRAHQRKNGIKRSEKQDLIREINSFLLFMRIKESQKKLLQREILLKLIKRKIGSAKKMVVRKRKKK